MTALVLAVCILLPPSGGISTTGIIEGTAPLPSVSPAEEGGPSWHGTSAGVSSGAVLPDTATAVSGKASWFCGAGSRCTAGYPASGLYAAAGPALRVGDWRGRIVTVRSGTRTVRVRLVDFCACGSGRVIDLYRSAFSRLASPSRGVIPVEVTWSGDEPIGTLPPTSTQP